MRIFFLCDVGLMFEDFSGKHGEFGFFVCDGGLVLVVVQQGMCGEHQQTCGLNQGNLGNLPTNMEGCETRHLDVSSTVDLSK